MFAVRLPDLAAAVPFYGGQPNAADVAKIKAPLDDPLRRDSTNGSTPAGRPTKRRSRPTAIKYEMFMYANTNHGFHNDTTPRYDEAAAKLAWSRTIVFFDKNLRN